jgi:dipeptidyl aminopeptidase/acylaminoacyl peptidase
MKKVFLLITLLIFLTPFGLFSQSANKKVIDHSVYDDWKSIARTQISDNGKWVSYEVNPQQGDGWLYIYHIETGKLDSIHRGYEASFMPDSDVLVFKIKPQYAVTRQAKVDKKKPDEMPKDSLAILLLGKNKIEKIERVKSFATPKEGSNWMVYQLEKEVAKKSRPAQKDTTELAENEETKKEEKKVEIKSDGTELVIFNPITEEKHSFKNITNYRISDNGSRVGFIQVEKDSIERSVVHLFATIEKRHSKLFENEGLAKLFTFSDQAEQAAFLHSADTAKNKVYSLYFWNTRANAASKIVDTLAKGMPQGYHVSDNASLRFSQNGKRLFVGTAPKPEPETKDTLLREEKYSLDVWSWTDDMLQPMQKANANRERNRTFLAVYHIPGKNFVQLASEDMPEVSMSVKGDGNFAIGGNPRPYLKQTSWEAGRKRDVYVVDVNTGGARLFAEANDGMMSISPGGNFIYWWNTEDRNWYAQPLQKGRAVNLSAGIPYELFNILHDTPSEPRPYGLAGWIENDRYLLVYDQFDIWRLDPAGKEKPVNLSGGYGRENNVRFRYVNLDREEDYIGRNEEMILSAFNHINKKAGFYALNAARPGSPLKLVFDDLSFNNPQKAKNAEKLVWTRSTFNEFPDLWVSNIDFAGATKISNANPQKDDYLWGSVELVEWTSFNQDHLQGLLYKPEDFDPSKKYPMLVYFYERSSDGLHNFTSPAPSASTINRAYSVSNGYLIFIPDIPYRDGWPGPSAYDAIVSGTYAMMNKYPFVDKDRIGLQGQSWGGYQIAYLITQTNLFRAAMAGAPVSNMISAYGGIRWESGMSRMFQYEQTQSRIGGTLWEKPMHYILNSPIFWAENVNTPLLMMHNDADGAVPWYQGIEYFTALRRLDKPVWMLVYNDEAHNLRRRPNRVDLSIRMYQFFDHYLKDAPMPVWMKEGIPFNQKGTTDGYELIQD